MDRPFEIHSVYSGGPDQADVTLQTMNKLINAWKVSPCMVSLARKMCEWCNAKTRMEEAEAIRIGVRTLIKYRRDPDGVEWLQDPLTTVHQWAGDCDDMATLSGSLLMAIGHKCCAMAVQWTGKQFPSHAVCFDSTTGMVVDPCSSDPVGSWPPRGFQVTKLKGASA